MLIGLLFIAAGIFLFINGLKDAKVLEKYAFNNRTDGGVVQFENYEAAQKFGTKKGFALVKIVIGGLVAVFGFIINRIASSDTSPLHIDQFAILIWLSVFVVIPLGMLYYIYKDAQSRGASLWLWLTLVFFTSIFGFIIYLIARPKKIVAK